MVAKMMGRHPPSQSAAERHAFLLDSGKSSQSSIPNEKELLEQGTGAAVGREGATMGDVFIDLAILPATHGGTELVGRQVTVANTVEPP